jgi:hypothetical protein
METENVEDVLRFERSGGVVLAVTLVSTKKEEGNLLMLAVHDRFLNISTITAPTIAIAAKIATPTPTTVIVLSIGCGYSGDFTSTAGSTANEDTACEGQ